MCVRSVLSVSRCLVRAVKDDNSLFLVFALTEWQRADNAELAGTAGILRTYKPLPVVHYPLWAYNGDTDKVDNGIGICSYCFNSGASLV